MPLTPEVYEFPALPRNTFHGLPGLLADSLPDKFGNALINAWLATQGRTPESFNAVERLCYTGSRGMGALEFVPALGPKTRKASKIEVDALLTIRQLKLPMSAVEEQFRRMAFNIVARNQDDHVKNIAFLMNKEGEWSLAPAFDVTYSYNPAGPWTATHQMTLNGKRDDFSQADLEASAKAAGMKRGRAKAILEEVQAAVERWPQFAAEAQLANTWRNSIQKTHRLNLPKT